MNNPQPTPSPAFPTAPPPPLERRAPPPIRDPPDLPAAAEPLRRPRFILSPYDVEVPWIPSSP
ncbi:MAG TPA: hypothetical protein VI796_07195 [Candidatus Thermoplasmatota archaeon]|nr:hypothetical protein [Candidatus Thermoplasmatota archaeon]